MQTRPQTQNFPESFLGDSAGGKNKHTSVHLGTPRPKIRVYTSAQLDGSFVTARLFGGNVHPYLDKARPTRDFFSRVYSFNFQC